jgi:hypothetical protein
VRGVLADLARKRVDSGSDGQPESVGKDAGKLFGWIDRRRHTLEILEEQIEQAREMATAKTGRGHDKTSRLEWSKTLLRLLELYAQELDTMKRYLHGDPTPGAGDEPCDDSNGFVEFERLFQSVVVHPWGPKDLELECNDCGKSSKDVSEKYVEDKDEHMNLCSDCYEKRQEASK